MCFVGLLILFYYMCVCELKLLNEKFHNLNCSPDMVRVIKSKNMRWTQHVAKWNEKFIQNFVLQLKWKTPFGKTRREWDDKYQKKQNMSVWTGFIWLRMGSIGGMLSER